MVLKNRLKERRQACRLTQKQLAGRVGVSRQTIIAIEQGTQTPSIKVALLLAQALCAPVDQIFWILLPAA